MTRTLRQLAVGIVTAGLLLACPFPAAAAIRTATATVPFPDKPLTADFPGMSNATLRYEYADGSMDVAATLRSPLADPRVTSALRKTKIELRLGDFYGDTLITDSCQSYEQGLTVILHLGDQVAYLDLGDPLETTDDLKVPLIVGPDRRSVSAHIPADPRVGPRNIICMKADLTGARGMASSAPSDFTDTRLLDGFDGRDGNIGLYATDDTRSQFRYIYNNLTDRDRDDIWDHPTWKASCSPPVGSVIVGCRGQGRIGTMVGRPLVTIRGQRIYQLVRDTDMFGLRGDLLRWDQNMRVTVRWKRCPREIDTRRAKHRRSCNVAMRWKTGRFLPEDLLAAVIRRAERTGTPPARRASTFAL